MTLPIPLPIPDPYAGSMLSSVPTHAWMGASAITGVIVMKTLDWWLSRRPNRAQENTLIAAADGTTKLIEHLNERIVALEGHQADSEKRLNGETTQRNLNRFADAVQHRPALRLRQRRVAF